MQVEVRQVILSAAICQNSPSAAAAAFTLTHTHTHTSAYGPQHTRISTMSGDGTKDPPPYLIPVEGQGSGVKVYHVHTPFTPPTGSQDVTVSQDKPVYTSGGGGMGSERLPGESKKKYVSYDVGLGRNPGMATCDACREQVMTNVTYKAGTYAWLMCLLFICCGLFLCCCLIPFFLDSFKDAYHTCPKCNKVLHIEKKECCK